MSPINRINLSVILLMFGIMSFSFVKPPGNLLFAVFNFTILTVIMLLLFLPGIFYNIKEIQSKIGGAK